MEAVTRFQEKEDRGETNIPAGVFGKAVREGRTSQDAKYKPYGHILKCGKRRLSHCKLGNQSSSRNRWCSGRPAGL